MSGLILVRKKLSLSKEDQHTLYILYANTFFPGKVNVHINKCSTALVWSPHLLSKRLDGTQYTTARPYQGQEDVQTWWKKCFVEYLLGD